MFHEQLTRTDESKQESIAAGYRDEKGARLATARYTDASWREGRQEPVQAAFDRLTRLEKLGYAWVERFSSILWTGTIFTLLVTLFIRLMDGLWFTAWLRPAWYVFVVLGLPVFVGALVRNSAGALLRALRWWVRRQAIEIVEAEEAP